MSEQKVERKGSNAVVSKSAPRVPSYVEAMNVTAGKRLVPIKTKCQSGLENPPSLKIQPIDATPSGRLKTPILWGNVRRITDSVEVVAARRWIISE